MLLHFIVHGLPSFTHTLPLVNNPNLGLFATPEKFQRGGAMQKGRKILRPSPYGGVNLFF